MRAPVSAAAHHADAGAVAGHGRGAHPPPEPRHPAAQPAHPVRPVPKSVRPVPKSVRPVPKSVRSKERPS
ncbi:hypothetical protein EDD93_5700 [Streptomyces sp. 840.1]|uniref:hypothetical protein n=1 Tax=Streptomyces sp. 840.1 TaxID=2485152 RepID=UPI000FB57FC2|nr:hypothetical protein [Streptomyces sp. 840.1]ROQ62969.1 hypothetical protein EDD93_5700 [Streptomyces sp. 840.1]